MSIMYVTFGSCTHRSYHAEKGKPKLFGGEIAAPGQFPWLVSLQMGGGLCTAAKIAPKAFLTAAHCLLDPETADLRLRFFEGAFPATPLGIDAKVVAPAPDLSTKFTPVDFFLHPSYASRAKDLVGKGAGRILEVADAADVAVVLVEEDSPGLATAVLAPQAPSVGDRVTVAGFGCETNLTDFLNGTVPPGTSPVGRLKFKETTLIDVGEAHHAGSPLKDPTTFSKHALLTRGSALDASEASLCPGDSGGPLSLAGTNVIVGVNSSYTFLPLAQDPSQTPYTNTFSRVDDASGHGVGLWIREAVQGRSVSLPPSRTRRAYTRSKALPVDGSAIVGVVPPVGDETHFLFRARTVGQGEITFEAASARGLSFQVFASTAEFEAHWDAPGAGGTTHASDLGRVSWTWQKSVDTGLVWVAVRNDGAKVGDAFSLAARLTAPSQPPPIDQNPNASVTWRAHCGAAILNKASTCFEMNYTGPVSALDFHRDYLTLTCTPQGFSVVENAGCAVPMGTFGCRNTMARALTLDAWFPAAAKAQVEAQCTPPRQVVDSGKD